MRAGFIWTNYIIQPGNSYQAALGDIYYPNNPNRGNCVGLPLNPDGSCTFTGVIAPFGNPTTEINRYSEVLGAWFRRGSTLHANFNAEVGGADNWIYRTDPLDLLQPHRQRLLCSAPLADAGRQPDLPAKQQRHRGINYNQHNYITVLNATIIPALAGDSTWHITSTRIQQNIFLCFQSAAPPPGSTTCLGDDTSLMQIYGIYQTHTQYGYFALRSRPSSA